MVTLETRPWPTLLAPSSSGLERTLNPNTGLSRGPCFLSLGCPAHRALVGVACWGAGRSGWGVGLPLEGGVGGGGGFAGAQPVSWGCPSLQSPGAPSPPHTCAQWGFDCARSMPHPGTSQGFFLNSGWVPATREETARASALEAELGDRGDGRGRGTAGPSGAGGHISCMGQGA